MKELLDKLAELYAKRDLLKMDYNKARDEILTAVRDELNALDAEILPKINSVEERAAALEEEIKSGTLAAGETQRGDFLIAVWNKGRETWDTKALTGYAAAHPEVLQCKKAGDPSVVIRKVG